MRTICQGGTKQFELKTLQTFAVKIESGGVVAAIARSVKYRISITYPLKKEKIDLYQTICSGWVYRQLPRIPDCIFTSP